MKKIMVVLVSFVVAVLIGVGNAFAQDNPFEAPPLIPPPYPYEPPIPNPPLGPEWELVGRNPVDGTTLYVNTSSITYLPGGIVKVWDLQVPRGEARRTFVNDLKNDLLLEGEDPNDAERLWYIKSLDKFNCETHQVALLEVTAYSFGQVELYDKSHPHEKWGRFFSGSPDDIVERLVCK